MNEQMQALAFMAGANSIFYGECLLTTPNPEAHKDKLLFKKLGISPERGVVEHDDEEQEAELLEQVQKKQDESLFVDAAAV